jgi:hypothetical protein
MRKDGKIRIMETQQNSRAGWLYVLYDAENDLCKIGCTAQADRKRQRALMAAHSHKLLNLLNAEVDDRYAAENQCHRHFAEHRRNGEWFAVRPHVMIEYVYFHVDHAVVDFEPPFNLLKAINDAALRRLAPPRKRKSNH